MAWSKEEPWDADPVIVVVAPVGAEVTREEHPGVPFTPEEVLADAKACCAAGASAIHLHLREDDGTPSVDPERYREVIASLHDETDAVVMVSTGGGAGMTFEQRMAGLCEGADVAGVETGSVNFGDYVFATTRSQTLQIAENALGLGIPLEVEAFDLGHIAAARRLRAEGHLGEPVWNLVFGAGDGADTSPEALASMRDLLPPGASWTVTGVGRCQRRMIALGILGGATAIRVGLEDGVYLGPGVKAADNAELVAGAVALARSLGREPADAAFARSRLIGEVPSLENPGVVV